MPTEELFLALFIVLVGGYLTTFGLMVWYFAHHIRLNHEASTARATLDYLDELTDAVAGDTLLDRVRLLVWMHDIKREEETRMA